MSSLSSAKNAFVGNWKLIIAFLLGVILTGFLKEWALKMGAPVLARFGYGKHVLPKRGIKSESERAPLNTTTKLEAFEDFPASGPDVDDIPIPTSGIQTIDD